MASVVAIVGTAAGLVAGIAYVLKLLNLQTIQDPAVLQWLGIGGGATAIGGALVAGHAQRRIASYREQWGPNWQTDLQRNVEALNRKCQQIPGYQTPAPVTLFGVLSACAPIAQTRVIDSETQQAFAVADQGRAIDEMLHKEVARLAFEIGLDLNKLDLQGQLRAKMGNKPLEDWPQGAKAERELQMLLLVEEAWYQAARSVSSLGNSSVAH